MKRQPTSNKKEAVFYIFLAILLSTITSSISPSLFFIYTTNHPQLLSRIKAAAPSSGQPKRLVVYNKPPKTGSTTIRVAMSKAMAKKNMKSARCFSMTEWNDMSVRSIVNIHNIDFWGCHVRLHENRYKTIASLRNGNVLFMSSTRDPKSIILSAFLQQNRARQDEILSCTKESDITKEVKLFKQFVDEYPIDALYDFHGAAVPLKECPPRWSHVLAIREVAERYEIIVDLERPEESAAMVEKIVGVKPDFDLWLNPRTTNTTNPVLSAFLNVDTSHRSCGNDLVHKVMLQRFNLIKDRLMQNGCFDEDTGTYELCDKVKLTLHSITERTRLEILQERERLITLK